MRKSKLLFFFAFLVMSNGFGQAYKAGFKTLQLVDSARIYKPDTRNTDRLHYRPVDLDIWYPSNDSENATTLKFRDLFQLFEKRAVNYQDNEDYSGITEELARFYVAGLNLGTDGDKLLNIETTSYDNPEPSAARHPLIIYMAGFNGMGFENFKLLEKLAQNGYIVVSIWSVGRYPGDMTNEREDMLEQVYDAEFALKHLRRNNPVRADFEKIGIVGCSWGGLSAAVLVNRIPEIKAFVPLDGTETHYFGEEESNDRMIARIHGSELLTPGKQDIAFLYLESGDKLDNFKPTAEYNYYRQLTTEKYYLRFKNSTHADFTCIPSILSSTGNSVIIYETIESATMSFFNSSLRNSNTFRSAWDELRSLDFATEEPYAGFDEPDSVFIFQGIIRDRSTNEPISYVNIGVLNKETGTVSNTAGRFTLDLGEAYKDDTIRISSIGYKPEQFLVSDVMQAAQPMSINMKEQVDQLEEVIIRAAELRQRTLGNKTESRFLSTGFGYDQLGAEMGVSINIRQPRTFVDAFNFNISYNRLSATSIFRINIYKRKPDKSLENILDQNILITIEPEQTGKIKVDLTPYDIILDQDVIVALEWVDVIGEMEKGEAIFFSLGVMNSGTLYKKASQSKFRKHNSMGVGFNVDVRY